MKRTLTLTLFILALLLAPALAVPAAAQVYGGLSVGGWFRVGPVSLSLAFGTPFEGAMPGYYYRVPVRYGYLIPPCQDAFRLGPYLYYDASCSAMDSFLGYYHQSPDLLFRAYAPPPIWRGLFYRDRYDAYGRYGRYDARRDRDWRRDWHRERGRAWSRSERRDSYQGYGVSRRETYGQRSERDRNRDRDRDHDEQWRHHE